MQLANETAEDREIRLDDQRQLIHIDHGTSSINAAHFLCFSQPSGIGFHALIILFYIFLLVFSLPCHFSLGHMQSHVL